MPMPQKTPPPEDIKQGFLQYTQRWGENSLPPTLTAALIAGQHLRPFQTLPMLFPPILLLSSYLNINGFKKDAAGLSSAWSAAYLVLARRRKHAFKQRFGTMGLIRGATLGLCLANAISGGLVFAFSKREAIDEEERKR